MESIEAEINNIEITIKDSFPYSCINIDFIAAERLFTEAKEKSKQLTELNSYINSIYEKTVFSIDYSSIYSRYKTEYTSFLKVFKIASEFLT